MEIQRAELSLQILSTCLVTFRLYYQSEWIETRYIRSRNSQHWVFQPVDIFNKRQSKYFCLCYTSSDNHAMQGGFAEVQLVTFSHG
jgi:hypothetical protein